YRSKGKEQAEVIRADADRQRAVLEANAYRDAERLRGDGDAKAAAIYAEAYNKDAEFYAFVRSLNAYVATFDSKEDLLVIDPASDFFRFLKDPSGKKSLDSAQHSRTKGVKSRNRATGSVFYALIEDGCTSLSGGES